MDSKKILNSYERFEFLGDRVLNLIVSHHLYENPSEFPKGYLTKRMRFASNDNLEEIFENLPVDLKTEVLKFKSKYRPGESTSNADAIEAYVGCYYLENKFEATIKHFEKIFAEHIDRFNPNKDYISRLKEYSEQKEQPQPAYTQQPSEKGEKNQEIFHFHVVLSGKNLGSGKGTNYAKAKQMAAYEALKKLGLKV